MSGTRQIATIIPNTYWLDILSAHRNRHRSIPDDMPNRAHVRYIGSFSSTYVRNSSEKAYIPVDSAAELFSLIPENYGFVGSQLAGYHKDCGGIAIPYDWGDDHCRISELACGQIRVLVAFILSRFGEDEPQALLARGGATTALEPLEISNELARCKDGESLYELLCRLFCETHHVVYNSAEDNWYFVQKVIERNAAIISFIEMLSPPEGAKACSMLFDLAARPYSWGWCNGLRALGKEVMLHQKSMFAGPELALWLIAIQQEYEDAARHAMAAHVWIEERKKARQSEDDD